MYEVNYTNQNGQKSVKEFEILDDALLFVNYCFFRFLWVSDITTAKKVLLPYLDTLEKRNFFFTLLSSKEIALDGKTYRMFKDGVEIEYHKNRIIRFPTLHDFFAFTSTTIYHSKVYLYNKIISEEVQKDTYYDRDGNLAYETVDAKRVEIPNKKKDIQPLEK